MSLRPTSVTATLRLKPSGADNVWSVKFADRKVCDFARVLRWAARLALTDTVARLPPQVQSRLRSARVHAETLQAPRPVRTYKTLAGVSR